MSFRRNLPILIALCISVALHLLSLRGAQLYTVPVHGIGGGHKPAPEEVTVRFSLLDSTAPKLSEKPIAEKKPPEAEKLKVPEKPRNPEKPKTPVIKPKPKKPEIKYPNEMGERTGTGIGSNKSEGDQPIQAREADEDQAFLSRNPGSSGRAQNKPADWLISPGENGRGGHPGSAQPPGAASSASDDVPVPSEPAAAQAPPHPRENQRPDTQLPAPPDLPVPPARVDKTDDSASPEPSQVRPAFAVPGPAPLPAHAKPDPTDVPKIAPIAIGPKVALTPPAPGDDATKGAGRAGLTGEQIAMPGQSDPAAVLQRTTTQPSRDPGHVEGAPVALQMPVPRVAPSHPDPAAAHDAPPQSPRPLFALLPAPPSPMAPTPEPPEPQIQPPQAQPAQVQPAQVQPAQMPAKVEPAPADTPDALKPARPLVSRPEVVKPAQAAPNTPPAPPAGSSSAARATGDGRQPGAPRPSGDPGQMSDSESDPFSKIGSAQIPRDGKLEVRFGRKIKTVRPHIPIVGQVDSFTMLNPSVTLRVSIDTAGNVTEVAIQKSSGSNEIDQPTLIAMYDWWFEPLRDAKGNAIPDTVLFTISFR